MYKDYNLTHEAISFISYKRVLKSMNIGFSKLSQDKCDFCEAKNHHLKENNEHNEKKCTDCIELKNHLQRAKLAREEYYRD